MFVVLQVGIRSKCFVLCDRGCQSPCQGITYRRTAEVCELFYYKPSSYDLRPDCVHFQVVNNPGSFSERLLNMPRVIFTRMNQFWRFLAYALWRK